MTGLMRRILVTFPTLIICCAVLLMNAGALTANAESRAIISLSSRKVVAGSALNIAVRISDNKGISNLRLNLIYDDSVMTLTNVQRGQALSSLDFITTDTSTEEGYGIKPFMLMWDDIDNDSSNGTIATLTFSVNEDAPHGSYNVSIDYELGDIAYIDDIKLIVADISIEDGTIIIADDSELYDNDEDKPKVVTIVLITAGGAGSLGAILYFIAHARKIKIIT